MNMNKKLNIEIDKKIFLSTDLLLKEIKNQKFVLCHGVFDLVHPGHLRQFVYAKKFAPILVVSVTSDNFIFKDNLRPYVNQELRCLNLAHYEIVDYVIVDNNPKPLKLIQKIKPKYFIKGYEYQKLENKNTKEEKKILNKIKCKFIFSPGDVVFSSSNFIKSLKPNIKFEKLFTLLRSEKLKIKDLKETVKKFSQLKVSILGDTIVDKYSSAVVVGGMHKSPTISVKILEENYFVGGAAIVAMHVAATGAKVKFSTMIGNDKDSKFIINQFKRIKNIDCNFLHKENRPTTQKNNIVVDNVKLLKIDNVDNSLINEEDLSFLLNKNFFNTDGVILSDFRHGIFNNETIPKISKFIKNIKFKVADTQVASRWGNLTDYKNFDLLTPNEKEVRFALADQDSVIRPLGYRLMKSIKCKNLFITLGSDGVISIRDKNYTRSSFHLESLVDKLVDPVGAGDSFLAYSTLSMMVTKNDISSVILGSIASKISCEKLGNITISPQSIFEYLNKIEIFEKNF